MSGMSAVKSARVHRRAVKALVGGALLFCAMGSGLCQIRPEPYMFFNQYIALKDDQIANIGHGKVVAQVLPTSAPSEIVAFGAIYIKASPEGYLRLAQNLDNLRGLPNYLGIRQWSAPPKLSDFEGFVLEDDDINELKSCRPGKCQLQLPTESVEEFHKSVDWSAPDVVAHVNKLAQKMALGELSRYQKDYGDSALGTYSDKKYPMRVADQVESLLSRSASMTNYLPDLQRYLIGYPQAQLPHSENFFYWERVKFGLKPTLRMNHMVIYRGSQSSGLVDSVAIKQLYASHYFETALDLSVCVRDSSRSDEKGFYLITVKGSRQAGLSGPRGAIIRKAAVSRTRSSLDASLTHVKTVLESSQ
jgi:hypothetical protein